MADLSQQLQTIEELERGLREASGHLAQSHCMNPTAAALIRETAADDLADILQQLSNVITAIRDH